MTQLFILENECFNDLDSSQKDLLEKALRRIPGLKSSRLCLSGSSLAAVAKIIIQDSDSLFVVPVLIPSHRRILNVFLDAIQRSKPLPALCAICFVLVSELETDPLHWLDNFWTELLDNYSDMAVPSSLVVWDHANSRLNTFRIVEAISSLARELDTLAELGRLDEIMHSFEEQIAGVRKKLEQK